MVVICADILRYCFGNGTPSVAAYLYLESQVSQWYVEPCPTAMLLGAKADTQTH